MTVKELIEKLTHLPQDANVYFVRYPHYLEHPRLVSKVYTDKDGDIIVSNS